MKKPRKLISMILLCSVVLFSTFMFTNDTSIVQADTYTRLSDKTLTLELGHYKTINVYGTTRKASWHSSNTWVATVTGSGKVTAKAVGSATITAYVGGKRLTCKLNVIRIKKALTLTPDQTYQLSVSGTKSPVSWSSGDTGVAAVADDGSVTAVAPGIAVITAFVDGKALTCKVSVVDMNTKEAVMEIGGFSGYTYYLKVNNAAGKITWSSSNPSVAAVSDNGTVSAKAAGSAVITASVDGVKLNCQIKVLAENIRTFTLKLGETEKLEILGTDSEIKWHSNNETIALVSQDGTVSTVAPGSCIIMAYVDGRNVMSRVTVTE